MTDKKKRRQPKVDRLHLDEKGNPFHPENRVSENKLSKKDYTKHIYRAIDLFKEGLPRQSVLRQIMQETNLSENTVVNYITSRAIDIINSEFTRRDSVTVSIHLERYNREILRLRRDIKLKFKKYSKPIQIKMKISAYFDILSIMFAKERLLQLHNRGFVVKFNQNNTTVVVQKTKSQFDLSNLSFEEKVRFLQLIEKSKRTSDEVFGVVLNQNKVDEEVEDISHEELEDVNVSKIQQFQPEVIEEVQPNSALFDVKEKLRLALLRVAEEEFKKSGSKLLGNEKS